MAGKLRRELPGILNWAIEGCLRWQQKGLVAPQEVIDATSDYRSDQDTIEAFLQTACVANPGITEGGTKITDLFVHYEKWCQENGERAGRSRTFTEKLKRKGYKQSNSNSVRRWNGIMIKQLPQGHGSNRLAIFDN